MNETKIIKRIDVVIRFFLYLLMFWLPYSSAVVEVCVVASLLLWLVKRFLSYDFDHKHSSLKDSIVAHIKIFKPRSSFLVLSLEKGNQLSIVSQLRTQTENLYSIQYLPQLLIG